MDSVWWVLAFTRYKSAEGKKRNRKSEVISLNTWELVRERKKETHPPHCPILLLPIDSSAPDGFSFSFDLCSAAHSENNMLLRANQRPTENGLIHFKKERQHSGLSNIGWAAMRKHALCGHFSRDGDGIKGREEGRREGGVKMGWAVMRLNGKHFSLSQWTISKM